MELLIWAILFVLFGLIPAAIAKGKGYSFGLWWFYGTMLGIIALIHSLIVKPSAKSVERQQLSDGMKKCPHCAEFIKGEAVKCRYCGSEIAIPAPKYLQVASGSFLERQEGTSLGEYQEQFLAHYGVTETATGYQIGEHKFGSFQELVSAIKAINQQA
ncbi:MAG: hypothetical protein LBQ81_05335 [Zoogloeaceae bacterium]|jgi:hypothetical protein|nr:hypothetical protein [Zoogloeaceae bacterium]